MVKSGRRHLLSFPILALMVTGAPVVAHGRHLRHHGEDLSAQMDKGSDQARGRPTAFAASIDGMIRACAEQATELQALPLEVVAQAVQLSDDQRAALEQVRTSAGTAAKGLDANCPRSIPVELGAKLDALRDALSLLADSFRELRPAVVNFHALLDDDQKGRLLAMGVSGNPASGSGQTGTQKHPAADSGAEPSKHPICSRWGTILMSWPIKQIDAGIELSSGQRAALYELSAAIYRSAEHLAGACPGDNAATALGRLDARHAELQVVRQDIEAIQPSTIAFENALNEAQKKQLAEATGAEAHTRDQQAGEIVAQSSVDHRKHRGETNIAARARRSGRVHSPWFGFAFAPNWRR